MDGDYDTELAELAALTAAHLRYEMSMANPYLPKVAPPPLADLSEPPPAREAAPRAAAKAASSTPSSAPSSAPTTSEPTSEIAPVSLEVLAADAASCTACRLHEGRTKSVFARGSAAATVMFIGEGPGYHEDQQGLPFVGKAGQLLDKMIGAMGLGAEEFYICNVVKCRPPENRTPTPDEAAACIGFLQGQIRQVRPQVIVALGRHAAHNLGVGDGRWRGRWGTYEGIDVMPTYHPAYLLRSPEQKRPVWQDLQAVLAKLGRELPPR